MPNEYVLLALGSNVGDRRGHLINAIDALEEVVEVIAESSIYETEPIGAASGRFLNMTIVARATMSPEELLAACKYIERDLGRTAHPGLVDREIDIDLLVHGDERRDEPDITLPHPRMLDRDFVLAPLVEIVPRWRHPVSYRRYADLFDAEKARTSGTLRIHSPAPNPHRMRQVRSCARETVVFRNEELRMRPASVSEAFLRNGRVIIKGAITEQEIESFKSEMEKCFAEVRRNPDRFLFRGQDFDGYTPPGGEGVTGKGPDVMRHFWDVTDVGGKLEEPFRTQALALRQKLVDVGLACLKAIDPHAGNRLFRDAQRGGHPVRVMRYLNAVNDGSILFPEHKDWDYATVHVGGAKAGIELLDQDGEWIQGDIGPGDILFFPGSALSLYGKDLPKALPHRVRAVSVDRTSVIAWIVPAIDVVLPSGESVADRYVRLMKQVRHAT